MVELNCPKCGKTLRIPDEYRGQTGKCNGCGTAISVPGLVAPPPIYSTVQHDGATSEQIDYLVKLGADPMMLHGITKPQASALMRELRDDPRILANEIVKAKERSDRKRALYGCSGCLGIAIFFTIGLPMCAGVIGSLPPSSQPGAPAGVAPVAAPVEPLPSRDTITLAKFNQIRQGMSYQQVVSILGKEGTVMSENSIEAGQFSVHTIMYTWEAGFMANMNAMFQNGKLVSKAQLGLR